MAIKKGGSSSVVEHQLPKLRVAGSTPVSRSESQLILIGRISWLFFRFVVPFLT